MKNWKLEIGNWKLQTRRASTDDERRTTNAGLAAILVFIGALCGLASAQIWHGCALTPARDAWVVAQDTPIVYHSSDFGAHWDSTAIRTDHTFFDVFFLDSLNGWTCGVIGEVWHTTDAGASWHFQGFGDAKFFTRICAVDTSHAWAAGGEAFLGRWDEADQSWDQVFTHQNSDTVDYYGISFSDTLHGWMCAGQYPVGDSWYGGQGYIVKSTDGGADWSLLKKDTTNDYFDIDFLDSLNGWVVGGDDRTMTAYVARTSDGGATWVGQQPDSAGLLRAVKFLNHQQGWAVGKFGTIIHTTDDGATWHPQVSGVDSTLFAVSFSDSLYGMACGMNEVVFTSNGGRTWVNAPPSLGGILESPNRTPEPAAGPWLEARPSVARGPVAISFGSRTPGPWSGAGAVLSVFDVRGARVKTIFSGQRSAVSGQRSAVWDGRDAQGRAVGSGIYVLRLSIDGGAIERKVVYVRQ
jgi:photosystem II stability/assembly factor-like uncharacterized protein